MPTSTANAINLPFDQAVDFFRQKINMPAKHWTAVMDEGHSRAFMVAGAASKALVGDFREAVHKAIAEGTTLAEFRKDFDTIVARHGWSHTGTADWRARVIYQTNTSTAYSAGRYAQMTDPDVLAAFPYWQYLHVNCPNPRLQHLAWSGMVLRADDAFWATCYPPNGWGCHCMVVALNDRMLKRQGKDGPDDSPKLDWRTYEDRTTGVVTKYPAGVDPGFAYNPGKAWAENAKQWVTTPNVRPVGPVLPVLAPAGKTAVAPDVLQQFVQKPEGAVQVGELDKKVAKALGASSQQVLLSSDTMKKQLGMLAEKDGHPEVFFTDYVALDAMIAKPAAVYAEAIGHIRMVGLVGDQLASVVIKRTQHGHETYLKSFYLVGLGFLQGLAKRKPLDGDLAELLEIAKVRALKGKQVR